MEWNLRRAGRRADVRASLRCFVEEKRGNGVVEGDLRCS